MAGAATIGAALERARDVLEAAGVADARREALELAALLRRSSTGGVWLAREQDAGDLEVRLAQVARRRAAGWPAAYAAGAANFRGHWLAVDRRVLIPRPETEGLVELVLAWIGEAGRGRGGEEGGAPLGIAEPCTGSGAIAVALALEAPFPVRVIATDRSVDALDVARLNLEAHGVGDRVELRRGDLLAPLAHARVDAVVCNPPYVAESEWDGLEPGVRAFEPREALVGGPDGLAVTRALVTAARATLRPGGLLAVEVDARRAQDVAALARREGFTSCETRLDPFGRPRYVRAWRPAHGSD